VVRALSREGQLTIDELPDLVGSDRVFEAAEALEREGLVERTAIGELRLKE